MCSWCYAFAPAWEALKAALPPGVAVQRVLGGLAPDTDQPMPQEMRDYLRATWTRIERQVPGTRFNFDFWTRCEPRRATYPACRAVIAARAQGEEHDERMTQAIQRAYYREARNPSDRDTLVQLAGELGLERDRFAAALEHTGTQRALEAEIARARGMGADSFPSLVLEHSGTLLPVPIDYTAPERMREALSRHLAA